MEQERIIIQQESATSQYDKGQSAYVTLFRSVYMWMAFALAITGLTALVVYNTPELVYTIATNQGALWGLLIAEILVVVWMTARLSSMSFLTATLLFIVYSVLNGATMSILLLIYTAESIATTFFVTAGTFGAMSLVGFFIKKDLSSMGRIMMMALIGLIIATVVNIFWANSTLYWICTYAGVLLFTALTAYDTQKIKMMLQTYGTEVNDSTQKIALIGALNLYLDFINLFLYLLRIFGDRK